MERPTQTIPQVEQSVGTALLKGLLTEIQQLQRPWQAMSEQEQRFVIERLRAQIETCVRCAVQRIASADLSRITAHVEQLIIKDQDEAKCVLLVSRGTQALHELTDHVGSKAVIVFADEQEFIAGMETVRAQADQPELPLEEPGDLPAPNGDGEATAAAAEDMPSTPTVAGAQEVSANV